MPVSNVPQILLGPCGCPTVGPGIAVEAVEVQYIVRVSEMRLV